MTQEVKITGGTWMLCTWLAAILVELAIIAVRATKIFDTLTRIAEECAQ